MGQQDFVGVGRVAFRRNKRTPALRWGMEVRY